MSNEHDERHARTASLKRFTVSGVYDDGLEAIIVHCTAADAQAARDYVVMKTGGRVVIASVFDGHLSEPDATVFRADQDPGRGEKEVGGDA